MTDHMHWWLAAASFVLGMVLTVTLTARPTKTQMPAWVLAQPAPHPQPEPPAMRVPAAEAPTEEIPVARPRPVKKKAVSKAPPAKRRPVPRDEAKERIPVARKRPAKKVPGRKVPGKKAPAKKVRPKDPVRESISVVEAQAPPAPLVPYAPYGPGSMRADPDGNGPEGWPVKGRTDSRLFYTPDDEGYDDIEAQVWFENEDFATRAFFTPGRNSARKAD
ncbi:putative membrane protein ArfC [Mycobacterium kiyosense]|uniref:Membrane protein ArfC n=2 Tax=Mycobacteriaceae TaxID=1762 RepID=A0A9P3UX71_9MYCO|nr:hypothetical protein [Mycobacterium kiyosense]BDE16358.1 putative membrane protein ArfC [Mycobacterium sp. 20KCMC460]BDB44872.1 putative membrane protein ArfC [Mycobacterium kiyosense]GLB82834.1 putative membrane protein ArfC [Mycobacterium kiyosense]GLB94926.1 putative membrane protein ArfC [Mycobacterium kiyosense]GLC00413.1 putative membrane protein ArfC [Mycobacterium kiyosense]